MDRRLDPAPDRGPGLHARGRGPHRSDVAARHHRSRDGSIPDSAPHRCGARGGGGRTGGSLRFRARLGFAIPEELLVDPGDRTVFALFVATALSISAIPVLAKILMDLDLMRREFGQTLLAAGMIDDITGWTLLGLVTALASAEAHHRRLGGGDDRHGGRLHPGHHHRRTVAGRPRPGPDSGPIPGPGRHPDARGRARIRLGSLVARLSGWSR